MPCEGVLSIDPGFSRVGRTENMVIEPGFHRQARLSIPVRSPGIRERKLFVVITSELEGKQVFKEEDIYFLVHEDRK